MIASIVFSVICLAGFGFFGWNLWKIRYNINLGKNVNRSDNKGERLKTMLLVAFGQKKMFARPIPALLHLAIYVAFVITQIERSEEHTSELQSQFHLLFLLFFFNDPAPTEISPLPLHDALPIYRKRCSHGQSPLCCTWRFTWLL